MSFFNKQKSPQGTIVNPYQLPVSIPIDLTKKGNKIEAYIKIEENYGYVFELEFRYYNPKYDKNSKYYESAFRSFFQTIARFEKYFKEYTQEEKDIIWKDAERVGKLLGYGEFVDHKRVEHPATLTPVHLVITKLEKNGDETILFDEIVKDFQKSMSGYAYYRQFKTKDTKYYPSLSKLGTYKISLEMLEDAPELAGTDIYLTIARPAGKP